MHAKLRSSERGPEFLRGEIERYRIFFREPQHHRSKLLMLLQIRDPARRFHSAAA